MPSVQTPVYVKVDEFKEIISILNQIKTKVNEAHETIAEIDGLKAKEYAELETWKQTLNTVNEKVGALDTVLFEQQ